MTCTDDTLDEPSVSSLDAEVPPRKFPTWAEREARARDRVAPDVVDFDMVCPSHWDVHDRLENWAKWCRSTSRQCGVPGSPMFRLHKPDAWFAREHGTDTTVPVDPQQAQKMQKGVAMLPLRHRKAIHWSYLHPSNPKKMARALAVSLRGLSELVQDARQILINLGY